MAAARPRRARPGVDRRPPSPTRSSRPTTWCPTLDERRRLRDRRAGRRQHGPGPARRRLPRGPAGRVRPGRRPADLRRGHHRLPRRPTAAPRRCSASRPTSRCFGKVIGGGLRRAPSAAGPTSWTQLAPLGPVYQAGTLSGNPLATAAGLAALDLLDARRLRPAHRAGRRASPTACAAALAGAGLPAVVPRVGTLVGLFFGDRGAHRLRRAPAPPTRPATPPSSTPCSTAGRGPRARRLRGAVPRPRPHRRRHRRDRGCRPRGRRLARAWRVAAS